MTKQSLWDQPCMESAKSMLKCDPAFNWIWGFSFFKDTFEEVTLLNDDRLSSVVTEKYLKWNFRMK